MATALGCMAPARRSRVRCREACRPRSSCIHATAISMETLPCVGESGYCSAPNVMYRRAIRVGAIAASAWLCVGCSRRHCQEQSDGSVVACVDDAAVSPRDVQESARETALSPSAAKEADPAKAALELAIRRQLFAAEARRRKLTAPAGAPADTPAALAQALVLAEVERLRLKRDAISDEEARRFYEEHRELFGGTATFDDVVRLKAKNVIVARKREAALEQLSGELRKKADVKVFEGALAKVSLQ
jgi:hypothetical protein